MWPPAAGTAATTPTSSSCGGEARTPQVIIRRYHAIKTRMDFDIVVGIDMSDSNQTNAFWHYMDHCDVYIVVTSTPCTGLAGWQSLNRVINHAAWLASRRISLPLAKLTGQVATYQLRREYHFISEHPKGIKMYHLNEWRGVRNHPRLVWVEIHQSATGLRDRLSLKLIMKPTEIWASDERLVKPLRRLRCNRQHEHARVEGGSSHEARLWTWKLASSIAAGIAELMRQDCANTREHFPEVALGDPQLPEEQTNAHNLPDNITCKACRHRRAQTDTMHTREPDSCSHPHGAAHHLDMSGMRGSPTAQPRRSHLRHRLQMARRSPPRSSCQARTSPARCTCRGHRRADCDATARHASRHGRPRDDIRIDSIFIARCPQRHTTWRLLLLNITSR